MQYLHTMIRVSDLEANLRFFCDQLGMIETRRYENESGRFTLVFLAAPEDRDRAKTEKAPLIEITYNWPDEHGQKEAYTVGRGFGHLAFRVDDIYQTCKRLLASGVTLHRPPRDGHMAFIKSPEGISIELLQKGESLPPQEPWISMPNVGSW